MTATLASPAERSVACAINRAAGGRAVPGNQAHLLIDGPDTYRAMLDAMGQATRWIHFENYIIRSDDAGWRFAELLAARARKGIYVRVLYDWLGSITTARKLWKQLRGAGVEVRPFNPPRLFDAISNFSRNHRKLVVADGARAVLGGCASDVSGREKGPGAANRGAIQRWTSAVLLPRRSIKRS